MLTATRFRERIAEAALVVTGEGTVDASSAEGKVPAGVVDAAAEAGVPVVVFGGRVDPNGADALLAAGAREVVALSGDPGRARDDLVALGARLASS